MRISLRTRVLLALLGLVLVSLVTVSLFTLDTFNRLGQTAQQRSSDALSSQVERDLVEFNTAAVRENDRYFAEISSQAQVIAKYIAVLYAQPGTEIQPSDSLASLGLKLFPGGQFANGDDEPSSIFIPNFEYINPGIARDIQVSKSLEQLLPGVKQQLPSVVALYFGSQNNVLRYYPNIDIGNVLDPGFKVTSRPWYVQAVERAQASGILAGEARQDITSWTEPYLDATNLGLVTTAAVPVYDQAGQLLGVVGLDITLGDLLSAVESNNLIQGGYSILLDNQGKALVWPVQAYQDLLNRERQEGEYSPDLSQASPVFQGILTRMKAGESGLELIDLGDKKLWIAFSPVKTTGWSLASVVEPSLVLGSVEQLQNELASDARGLLLARMLPVTVGLAIIVIIIGLAFTDRWLKPIQSLAAASQQIAAGHYDLDLPPSSDDELGILSSAFLTMKDAVKSSMSSLEQRVEERTNLLLRRTAQLEAAADIARDITQTRDLDSLLIRAVNQIQDRFGYYHAGIFLLDNEREYAVLRAANSQGGMELINQGHRLRVGKTSIVGFVVETAQPRIALDTDTDVVHFKNPLLPETRSEAALPLIINVTGTTSGETGVPTVIGVLDVQSKEANAFQRDDITALQIMADQLAVALDNARLFREYQKNLDELEKLYSQFSRDAWLRLVQNRLIVGYELNQAGSTPLYSNTAEDNPGAAGGGIAAMAPIPGKPGTSPVSLPVSVRGEAIAVLEIWPENEGLGSEELHLLEEMVKRLGLALESARLYEDAQNRAAREQVINQFSASLSDTIDLNALLQAAVQQIGNMPNVTEASIRVRPA